ncbi:MAG: hypothetical protein CMG55_08750 [Candidatus Marinimicrobia bacterium]|nr:hypothetical protein [Candidatus Neomarinimicrobiota bacterium]|tara:strand:+ start:700 stop:1710 length:1011 start_codon:yes stop_codon:yes gene_type:complete
MKIKNKDTNDNVLIIAEIGNNHEGDFSLAKEMIYLAAESGVDAVKFQTFKTESFISTLDNKRFKQLKSFELTYEQFNELSIIAKKQGLVFISTPLDIDTAKFLPTIVDAIKISSGDNNFVQLLRTVSKLNKPLILSSGLMNLKQIIKSVNIIQNSSKKIKNKDELAILHCVTSYPVEPVDANLRAIQTLSNTFDYTIGYSDHTIGINAAISAVSLGARIIEKHFTSDHNFSDFRDHQLSADLDEMTNMVSIIREIEQMFGTGEKNLQKSEEDIIKAVRRSIVAKKDLLKGHIIGYNDLTYLRPGDGLEPAQEIQIIGKKLKHNVAMGTKILLKSIE